MLSALCLLLLQQPQNPSPMRETTRAHTRLEKRETPGPRRPTALGSLLLPLKPVSPGARLLLHFHGAPWLVEQSARQAWPRAAVLGVQLGAGSRVYSDAFREPGRLARLTAETGLSQPRITLSAWSAGYGAIREILRDPASAGLVDSVLLIDGLHAGYDSLDTNLAPFLDWARLAVSGAKSMLIVHTEIFPGTYASTTETADHLLAALNLRRKPVLRWGPLGMQQLSHVNAGRFEMLGFAGNSAPDHVDALHALAAWLRRLRR